MEHWTNFVLNPLSNHEADTDTKVSAQHSPMMCDILRAVNYVDTVCVLLTERDKHHGGKCDVMEHVLAKQSYEDRTGLIG